MTDFLTTKWVPPHVAALSGYHAAETVTNGPDVLKMDLNECQAPPSPRVVAALRAAVEADAALNWYPDSTCAPLRQSIGRYLHISADSVLVANGSNMAMELIARAFLTRDDPVLIVSPVYAVFSVQCKLQQARIETFQFHKPFAPDFAELLTRVALPVPSRGRDQPPARPSDACKIIYLANPNNPTGVGYPREQIRALVEKRPDTLIVLDEAYVEYCGGSSVDLVATHPNLLVLRSFSKAFSLAGMRCGYVVAQPAVLDVLARVLAPWAVSGLTQAAAQAAVEDLDYMRETVAECARARRQIVDGLTDLGFVVHDTQANFIIWQVSAPAHVVQVLAARHVYVSNKDSVPQLKGCLRLTVGNRDQAKRFLGIVEKLQARRLLEP
jgi:histidinol-phosphate aminotransferase